MSENIGPKPEKPHTHVEKEPQNQSSESKPWKRRVTKGKRVVFAGTALAMLATPILGIMKSNTNTESHPSPGVIQTIESKGSNPVEKLINETQKTVGSEMISILNDAQKNHPERIIEKDEEGFSLSINSPTHKGEYTAYVLQYFGKKSGKTYSPESMEGFHFDISTFDASTKEMKENIYLARRDIQTGAVEVFFWNGGNIRLAKDMVSPSVRAEYNKPLMKQLHTLVKDASLGKMQEKDNIQNPQPVETTN